MMSFNAILSPFPVFSLFCHAVASRTLPQYPLLERATLMIIVPMRTRYDLAN